MHILVPADNAGSNSSKWRFLSIERRADNSISIEAINHWPTHDTQAHRANDLILTDDARVSAAGGIGGFYPKLYHALYSFVQTAKKEGFKAEGSTTPIYRGSGDAIWIASDVEQSDNAPHGFKSIPFVISQEQLAAHPKTAKAFDAIFAAAQEDAPRISEAWSHFPETFPLRIRGEEQLAALSTPASAVKISEAILAHQ